MQQAQVTRVYIYEALVLIIASVLLGTIIGFLIGLTLTAQFDLFLALPLKIYFPYTLFFSVLIMSVIVAVVGSWLPVRALRNIQIAQVIKG